MELTNSQIQFVNSHKDNVIGKHQIYTTVSLKDNQNKRVSTLLFKRNYYVYFENVVTILYLIFVAFFINFIVSFIYTRKWVYAILIIIKNILETGNTKSIRELKSTTGEFRYICNLF